MDKFTPLHQLIQQRKQASLYRQPRTITSPQAPVRTLKDGKTLLSFCSNDYLGLANHPEVISSFQQAAGRWGVGSGAAHLVNGHTAAHQALEEALAAFTGRERALLFSTGYMANTGVISALLQPGDHIFEDRLNHASLLDGATLSGARLLRFAHNKTTHLQQRLASAIRDGDTAGCRLIAVDGVFSMDGDLAPVRELARIARDANAWLMVDDAHGFGVLGQRGAGVLEQEAITPEEAPILVGTLGKALGTSGAFVAGPQVLIDYLVQTSRPWIYTTAQPAAIAAATLTSLQLLEREAWRRERLQQLIGYFRRGAAQLGLPLMDSATAIQPLWVGDSARALHISQQLEQAGILVPAIRPPTVPPRTARLRITLSAAHEETQIDQLLDILIKYHA
ncbi:MAG TPA: 8-amino-7-oxononanoate synthase [Thiolinea sp.]|nr:8-amino-7-oxononanoate synthase [Thiolinea sp.]